MELKEWGEIGEHAAPSYKILRSALGTESKEKHSVSLIWQWLLIGYHWWCKALTRLLLYTWRPSIHPVFEQA